MSIVYKINNQIEQTIAMKINENLAFPEKFRIQRAELYTFNPKPRAQVWKDGTGKVQTHWTFPAWMKIYDQDGSCGEGQVCPEVWQVFLPMLLEDKEERTNLDWRRIFYWKERANPSFNGAMFLTEMLFFDLIAKKRGVPLHRMLGAKKDWCDCYKGGGSVLRTDEELVEEMLGIQEEGFKATKFKISLCGFERDVRRMELLRRELGPDFKIAVDSNQAWDAESAMEFIRAAHRYDIAWYEEPVVHTETGEIARLVEMMKAENLYVPLAYGESAKSFETYEAYVRAGVEVISPMPMLYTIAEALRAADYARSCGCRITSGQNYLHGCLMGALLEEGEPIEFHKPNTEYVERYFKIHSTMKNGRMYLPDIPGIPVRVDFEKLAADGCIRRVEYFCR